MDRTNIIYSSHNRPVQTAAPSDELHGDVGQQLRLGLGVGLQHRGVGDDSTDQTGSGFISQVSSASNMVIGVLFDYDNDELGTLSPLRLDDVDEGRRRSSTAT